MPLRVIFMGTPEFSVPTLRAIAEAGHEIAAVYTQPPRAAGRRGLELTPSPVQREAERLGIEVRTPTSLKGEAEQQAFAALQADVAVVVAYGLLLPKAVLEATAARLSQRPCLAFAALARCRAHPARHHGRRHRDRHDGDADGRGSRHRSGGNG